MSKFVNSLKLLTVGVVGLGLFAVGTQTTANARSRYHHYRYRSTRIYRHHRRSHATLARRRARAKRQAKAYKSLVHYLNWVKRYNRTHASNWHGWKLVHLNQYLSSLSGSQARSIRSLAYRAQHVHHAVRKVRHHRRNSRYAYRSHRRVMKRHHKKHSNRSHWIVDVINEPNVNDQGSSDSNAITPTDDSNDDNNVTSNPDLSDMTDTTSAQPQAQSINMSDIKNRTVQDINNERQANGLNPLQDTDQMDQLATMRAQQASSNFTHYDRNGQPLANEDAQQLGMPLQRSIGDGYYTEGYAENLADNYGSTGDEVADNANDDMMNHDADSGWGHRKNILGQKYEYLGVGVAPAQGEYQGDYTIAEDFF